METPHDTSAPATDRLLLKSRRSRHPIKHPDTRLCLDISMQTALRSRVLAGPRPAGACRSSRRPSALHRGSAVHHRGGAGCAAPIQAPDGRRWPAAAAGRRQSRRRQGCRSLAAADAGGNGPEEVSPASGIPRSLVKARLRCAAGHASACCPSAASANHLQRAPSAVSRTRTADFSTPAFPHTHCSQAGGGAREPPYLRALLLSYFASQNRSLFAAKCFVEVVLGMHRRGVSVDDVAVSKTAGTMLGAAACAARAGSAAGARCWHRRWRALLPAACALRTAHGAPAPPPPAVQVELSLAGLQQGERLLEPADQVLPHALRCAGLRRALRFAA